MKKIIALLLAMLVVLSMAACGTDNENNIAEPNQSQGTNENNSVATGDSTGNPSEKEMKYPLPELKPDGEHSIDLESEQVIYDKNDIKITYESYTEGFFGYELNVVIENNGFDNLNFVPYDAIINGMTFGCGSSISEPIAKGETIECTISVYTSALSLTDEYNAEVLKDGIKCFDLQFGFYDGDNVYGSPTTLIDNNVLYSFTKGEHDHRNDTRLIKGELIYEIDEMAIYLGKTFEEIPDKYYSEMTIINKTSKNIMVSSGIECIYTTAPVIRHFTTILGLNSYVAPNSYVTGKVYIDEEYSDLDMVELIMDKQCYYATPIDTCLNEDDCIDDNGWEGLEKMNCFAEKLNVPITVNKK